MKKIVKTFKLPSESYITGIMEHDFYLSQKLKKNFQTHASSDVPSRKFKREEVGKKIS
jgi:hypothetical protein